MKKENAKKEFTPTIMTQATCRAEVLAYIAEVKAHLEDTRAMCALDPMPLSILGVQLNTFCECAAAVSAEGILVHDDKTNLVPNPKIAIMNQAETMALKIMKEYGLLPKSRKELGKAAEPKKASPLSAFINKK